MFAEVQRGLRRVRRSSAHFVLAAVTLGIGVGLGAAMLTVVHSVLFRPLSFLERSHGIVMTTPDVLPADAQAIAAQPTIFRRAATMGGRDVFASDGSRIRPVDIAEVSPGFFDLFNVQPQWGRAFQKEEYGKGHDAEVILSYAYWRERYEASPAAALGTSILLGGKEYHTVIGVMPEWFRYRTLGFGGPTEIDVWAPLALDKAQLEERGPLRYQFDGEPTAGSDTPLVFLAELEPGLPLAEANRRLNAVGRSLASVHPQDEYLRTLELTTPQEWFLRRAQRSLWLLFGASIFALFVATGNYVVLAVASWAARSREVFLREALGASPARVLWLALSESLVEALGGAVIAVGVAFAGIRAFALLAPPTGLSQIPRLEELRLDWWAVGFALLASCGVATLGSVVAISFARTGSLSLGIRQGSSGTVSFGGRGSMRACGTLTALQVALSTVLLVAAGLVAKSLWLELASPIGFTAAGVQSANVGPSGATGQNIGGAAADGDLRRAMAALDSVPGVESTCLATNLFPWPGAVEFAPESANAGEVARTSSAWWQRVTRDYFDVMGIALLEGHAFSQDAADQTHEVVVSRSLAQEYFYGTDPVGARMRLYLPDFYSDSVPGPSTFTIAGVVDDVRAAGPLQPVRPEIYTAFSAIPNAGADVLVKSHLPSETLTNNLRAALAQIDPRMVATQFRPFLSDRMSQITEQVRFYAEMNAAFTLTAGGIALVGIYALSWLNVRFRVQEIAVRRAIGAQTGQILATLLRRVVFVTLAGVLLGACVAGGVVRLGAYWFSGVSPTDPWMYLGAAGLLATASIAASFIAARRAVRVNEKSILRFE